MLTAACGAGLLCGFILFYLMYRSQCAAVVHNKTLEFNHTMEKLQSVDDKKHVERQRHLLNQQTALTERHQNLLERLAETQNEHESTKRLLEESSSKVKQLQAVIGQHETDASKAAQTAAKKYERLQRQLELAKTMLDEKVDEVETLKASTSDEQDRRSEQSPNNDAYIHLQSAVRRQNAVQLGLLYGQTPYMIHLYLKSPSVSAFSVEVQIPAMHEMPHAIHSFLTLIKAKAFHETTLSNDGNGRLVGGSPASSQRKQVQSKLTRLYAEQGYSTEPLLFTERSSQACTRGSFGWLKRGPSLAIYVRDDNDDEEIHSCFGRIVAGFGSILSLPLEIISIVDARIVSVADTADDEL